MVYLACGLSAFSYGSESWTLRANHEHKLNIFTMQYVRRLLSIVFSLCKHWRMRLLSHVVRMDDDGYQRSRLYGELYQGTFPTGRTQLRYKHVCKWDLKFLRQLNIQTLQTKASDHTHCRQAVNQELKEICLWRNIIWDKAEKRDKSKETTPSTSSHFAEETATPVLDCTVTEAADKSW